MRRSKWDIRMWLNVWLALAMPIAAGCGASDSGNSTSQSPAKQNTAVSRPAGKTPVRAPGTTDRGPTRPAGGEASTLPEVTLDVTVPQGEPDSGEPPARTSLADLLEQDDSAQPAGVSSPGAAFQGSPQFQMEIDDTRAATAGIRKLSGKHLTLYTDVPPSPSVDELPEVFSAAVPQWANYFEIDLARVQDWHMTGFLMRRKEAFADTGLLPSDLPPFANGYQRGPYLWLYDQTEDFYRRHLLLHEGTHGFMDLVVGGLGPPWYAEGMAELLGTHRWENGRLQLGYIPRAKTESPGWGRIRIVQDETAAGRGMMPDRIMNFGPTAHQQLKAYGWCWALAAFLDNHPQYQQAFRRLKQMVAQPGLTLWFREQVGDDWADLCEDWQIYVMNIDYGYDIARAAIIRKPTTPIPPGGATATIAADHGWQSSGLRVEAGTAYQIVASGRYQIAKTDVAWWCEPGGVTIHYHQGRPLGMLLGAIRDDAEPLTGLTPLTRPDGIGNMMHFTPQQGGTLYLKINEAASGLADNRGEISVRIAPLPQ